MAVNKQLRSEDFSFDDIKDEVFKSLEGHIEPGRKIAGSRIFYVNSMPTKPRHDVIFFWRALYVSCIDEYEFAMTVFNDWEMYQKFVSCSSPYRDKFQPAWEKERELKYRSMAMSNVIDAVKGGDVKESKWLEKHIIDTAPKKDKAIKKKDTKKVIEDTTPIDDVMQDIETNYKNIN